MTPIMAEPRFERLHGAGLADRVDAIARLRMTVFREWPYLYEGDLDYERRYLRVYTDSPRSFALLVIAGQQVVGVSTALPLADEHDELARPFHDAGFDVDRVFYFAESVLLPEWRGQGLYRHFFTERETHARSFGEYEHATFCGVVRPHDHPLRPAGYKPLDPIWRRFGFEPRSDLAATFPWRDVGQAAETDKELVFHLKRLQ